MMIFCYKAPQHNLLLSDVLRELVPVDGLRTLVLGAARLFGPGDCDIIDPVAHQLHLPARQSGPLLLRGLEEIDRDREWDKNVALLLPLLERLRLRGTGTPLLVARAETLGPWTISMVLRFAPFMFMFSTPANLTNLRPLLPPPPPSHTRLYKANRRLANLFDSSI